MGLQIIRVLTLLTAIIMASAAVLLWVATDRLGDIANEQLNVSDSQLQISKNQEKIMQQNLDLIKPSLMCWWNSTDFENHSITMITVINFGQLPGTITKISARQPKLVEVGTNYIVYVNFTELTTPAYVIKGGERKVLPALTSNLTKINVANIYTNTDKIDCMEWVEDITTTYSNK